MLAGRLDHERDAIEMRAVVGELQPRGKPRSADPKKKLVDADGGTQTDSQPIFKRKSRATMQLSVRATLQELF